MCAKYFQPMKLKDLPYLTNYELVDEDTQKQIELYLYRYNHKLCLICGQQKPCDHYGELLKPKEECMVIYQKKSVCPNIYRDKPIFDIVKEHVCLALGIKLSPPQNG